jgi:hypothetical protein
MWRSIRMGRLAPSFACRSATPATEWMPKRWNRMFEPFFYHQGNRERHRMGLATVYGVLKQHGGWVEVESAVGKGTTIRNYFPLSDGADETEAPAEAAPAAPAAETKSEGIPFWWWRTKRCCASSFAKRSSRSVIAC